MHWVEDRGRRAKREARHKQTGSHSGTRGVHCDGSGCRAGPSDDLLDQAVPMKATTHLLLAGTLILGGCATGEHLGTQSRSTITARTPRAMAERGNLPAGSPAVATGWESAGSAALRAQLFVQPTFEEVLEFPADVSLAATYRFQLRRGDRLDVQVRTQRGDAPFADVFEVIDTAIFRHVYAADRNGSKFSYTATTDGVHVLRLQPPVSGGGRYVVHASAPTASGFVFPVMHGSPSSIAGQWGDARDGGSRSHKGVDIFAPRGTPVVAVSAGVITTVENTTSGGRVVWQRDDERGMMYYYAHLDEQLVVSGQHVSPGDTIGRVGNTGNAKGSNTHLHFGVFRPGYVAENPTPYLLATADAAKESTERGAIMSVASAVVPPAQLGTRVQLTGDRVRLRGGPSEGAAIIEQMKAGTEVFVLGSLNGWSRVVLADGRTGFIAGWLLPSDRRNTGTY